MNKKTWIITGIILLLLVIVIIFTSLWKKSAPDELVDQSSKTTQLCFYDEGKPNERGFYDVAWIRMNVTGDQVVGEFRNLPAEKDSKVGTFTGTISGTAPNQTIDGWWNSMAEGMGVKEQLILKLNLKDIAAGFSATKDDGTGRYVYEDPNNIPYWSHIPKVDCSYLSEKVDVKEYVRNHIGEIIGKQASLGGQWYIVQVTTDPSTNTGTVVAEDGHDRTEFAIQYTIEPSGAITVTKLEDK